MSEIWATIAEYPNYEISSHGRVRHKKTGRVRKPSINRGGYINYSFPKDGGCKNRTAHRLLHIAFLGPVDGLEVNHKDGDKLNNVIENLEAITKIENILHAEKLGLGPRPVPIEAVNAKTGEVRMFRSMRSAVMTLGLGWTPTLDQRGTGKLIKGWYINEKR